MMNLSYHCKVERRARVESIMEKIGLGQVIREKYVHSPEEISAGRAGRYLCVTDTGIIIVKTEDKLTVITMYVATMRELVMIYGGNKSIPVFLKKKVDRNQSKYTDNGKTIWR